ncbi:MAG: type I phosphomannose isomerase catalytic subunit [Gemmataceae bacterium]
MSTSIPAGSLVHGPSITHGPAAAPAIHPMRANIGKREKRGDEAGTMDPLVFEPYLRPTPWGGRKLGELFAKPLPRIGNFGESWEISPHPVHVSRVAQGPHQGKTLNELCEAYPRELLGSAAPGRFPLLIKLLDCRELLSIQVHPNDALASKLSAERSGKTEAWVVLHAERGAKIDAGFKPGVTRSEVERRLAEGTLEGALHSFSPRAGQCVYLPAGTVHAVGGGVVMAEVQQASDATFRLYDWNRVGADGARRQLHIPEALESIDWSRGPVDPVVPVLTRHEGDVREERLVHCDCFTLDRFILQAGANLETTGPTIWMVLSGAATVGCTSLVAGGSILVPANGAASIRAERAATLLRVRFGESRP